MLLVLVGAINWGLIGFFNYDLVSMIFGDPMQTYSTYARVVYAIVGIAGVWGLSFLGRLKGLGCCNHKKKDHDHHSH